MEQEILNYYSKYKRDLPWRKDRNPYYIWISEIMCQQTRVDTVIPYFKRFTERYPDINSLAESSEDELLKYWEGLGYYSRARNLRKAALIIKEKYNGVFPSSYEDIINLPGIGDYTACAILSMAFNLPFISVDGNFFRVFSRFYKNNEDISKDVTKENLKKKLLEEVHDNYGEFNQCVMDIGATICLPNEEPRCSSCPLNRECALAYSPDYIFYPYTSKKQVVKDVNLSVFIIKVKDKYILHKRANESLLHNLYDFRNRNGFISGKEINRLFNHADISFLGNRVHHFTHQIWHMDAYLIKTEECLLKEDEILVSEEELINKYSVPKAFNQFISLFTEGKDI